MLSQVDPSLHRQLVQVDPLLDYGTHVAQAVHLARQPLEPVVATESGGRHFDGPTLVSDLASSRSSMRRATQLISEALQARKSIVMKDLPGWAQRDIARLDPLLSKAPDDLRAATALPAALGSDGVRNYLVIPQNSHDLRATGGFIGTVAILQLDHGHAKLIKLQDSYAVDKGHRPDVDQPAPLFAHGWIPWYFRDANWSADFPTTAKLLEAFYQLGTQQRVDGVIAFDDQLLPGLFDALGPIHVPGYKETLTAANAFQRLDYQVNAVGKGDKAFALAAYKAVFAKLLALPKGSVRAVLDDIRTGISQHHIELYANDASVDDAISIAKADGAIDQTRGDYFYLVDTNTSTFKIAQLIDRSITYAAVIQPDRSVLATLTIHYTNHADAAHVSPLEAGSRFTSIVRVFVPLGSTLLGTRGFDQAWPTFTVHNKTQFTGYFGINAQSTHDVVLHYRIPANADPGDSYHLTIQKQAGVGPVPVRLAISAASGVRLHAASLPAKVLLDQDVSLVTSLTGGTPHLLKLVYLSEPAVTPGSHPEPWVTVPDGWVGLPDWAAVRTGTGWCVWGTHKVCHATVVVHKS